MPRIARVSSATVRTFAALPKRSAVISSGAERTGETRLQDSSVGNGCLDFPRHDGGCLTSKQLRLRSNRWLQSELPIRIRQRDATLRCPLNVAFHDQVGLVHFFERAGFFTDRDG